MESYIQQLSFRLKEPLPGVKAQARMSPQLESDLRFKMKQRANARLGSVLILLYPEQGRLFLPLMQRPEYDGHHSGQISLPGGKMDLDDPDRIYTALREGKEEIGISLQDVEVIGTLTELYIPPSNFNVLPVVAWTKERPVFKPDPVEVVKIIEASVDELLDENLIQYTDNPMGATIRMRTPYFNVKDHVVWGATAMILSEFIALIRELD